MLPFTAQILWWREDLIDLIVLTYIFCLILYFFIGPRSPGPIYVSGCHKLIYVVETLLM